MILLGFFWFFGNANLIILIKTLLNAKKLLTFFFKNLKSIGLLFLIILTVIIAGYSNQKENLSKNQNNDFINNIYFKKTLNEIVNNLEPRYKKYNHKIKSGETFDKILNEYSI